MTVSAARLGVSTVSRGPAQLDTTPRGHPASLSLSLSLCGALSHMCAVNPCAPASGALTCAAPSLRSPPPCLATLPPPRAVAAQQQAAALLEYRSHVLFSRKRVVVTLIMMDLIFFMVVLMYEAIGTRDGIKSYRDTKMFSGKTVGALSWWIKPSGAAAAFYNGRRLPRRPAPPPPRGQALHARHRRAVLLRLLRVADRLRPCEQRLRAFLSVRLAAAAGAATPRIYAPGLVCYGRAVAVVSSLTPSACPFFPPRNVRAAAPQTSCSRTCS